MSRHRNVRSMNYEDEYDGYDDVYGHSVEDDYCVSPGTAAQFMFNRDGSHPLASYVEPSIEEVDEPEEDSDIEDGGASSASATRLSDSCDASVLRQQLNSQQTAKLNSCLDEIRDIVGETSSEAAMIDAVLVSNYDLEKAINILLNQEEAPKPQRSPRRRQNRTDPTPSTTSTTSFTLQPAPIAIKASAASQIPSSQNKDIQDRTTDTDSGIKFSIGPASDVPTFQTPATSKSTTSKRPGRPNSDAPPVLKPVSSSSKLNKQNQSAGSKAQNGAVETPQRGAEFVKEFSDFGADATTASASHIAMLDSVKTPDIASLSVAAGLHKSASKAKIDKLDVQKEYERRKADGKEFLNLVVIGHVDAGKSTLMGHLLYKLGFVNKRTMHKYEQESRKLGKASFAYAWVLDETEEERSRGVTMDIAQTRFETDSKVITLLDAPGHKDFIPNMITGASQADVAVLVINATKGEFETGFEAGGQTREHAMLVRSLGVSQVLIAINKMDTVEWSKARYDEIVTKLGQFLKQVGFKESDVSYVPCSGLSGDNLTGPVSDPNLTSWYNGPTLVQQIDQFHAPERKILDKPLRMCVTDLFKTAGAAGFSVAGVVQAGSLQAGDRVLAAPAGEVGVVKGVTVDENPVSVGFAGDNVIVNLTGIDVTNITIGTTLCDPLNPVDVTSRLRARIVIFNINVPITAGFPVVFHYQSLTEQAVIRKLVSQLHRSTGEVIKKKPRCLVKNTSAVVDIEVSRPICIELYKSNKDLGRFMLRSAGTTIAAGMVYEILSSKPAASSEAASA